MKPITEPNLQPPSRKESANERRFNKLLRIFLEQSFFQPAIRAPHITLYVVILRCWGDKGCPDRLPISSKEMMRRTRLSRQLYYRSLRDLDTLEWIRYEPRHFPGRSWVGMD